MTVIDDYLIHVEASKRKQLERIRTIAKETVPDYEEVISYGIPTLKYKGRAFLGFAVFKNHIGIYPYSGETFKGTIRVPFDHPISETILKQVINYRITKIIKERLSKGQNNY